METFIEERAKLVRSLADNADPFIKRRLLMLAERYDRQLGLPSPSVPTLAVQEITALYLPIQRRPATP
jgi:hypothetical protein